MIRSCSTYVRTVPAASAPRVIDAVRPPSVCASGTRTVSTARPVSTTRAVVGELVAAELDLDRCRRDGNHGNADERLGRGGERLEVDRRRQAIGDAHHGTPGVDRGLIVLSRASAWAPA